MNPELKICQDNLEEVLTKFLELKRNRSILLQKKHFLSKLLSVYQNFFYCFLVDEFQIFIEAQGQPIDKVDYNREIKIQKQDYTLKNVFFIFPSFESLVLIDTKFKEKQDFNKNLRGLLVLENIWGVFNILECNISDFYKNQSPLTEHVTKVNELPELKNIKPGFFDDIEVLYFDTQSQIKNYLSLREKLVSTFYIENQDCFIQFYMFLLLLRIDQVLFLRFQDMRNFIQSFSVIEDLKILLKIDDLTSLE